MNELTFGAEPSKVSIQDIYAHQLTDMAAEPLHQFAIDYAHPHYNQKSIGICTAIDLIDMAEKIFGRKFSSRFQYANQKQKYDFNTREGSSILNACKVGYSIGFLPIEFDLDGNNVDKTHADFINKTYTAEQYGEAGKYKLTGYAKVALDPLNFAIALQRSKYGLMLRMDVGDNFYRPSWDKNDLEPLRAPNPITSGHSIKCIEHVGLNNKLKGTLRNTWGGFGNPTTSSGLIWCDDGNIKYIYETQKPYITEAYMVTIDPVTFKHVFMKNIKFGETSEEVVALQRVLVQLGYLTMPVGVKFGYYGQLTKQAVLSFQKAKHVASDNELMHLNGTLVGPATRLRLNENQ